MFVYLSLAGSLPAKLGSRHPGCCGQYTRHSVPREGWRFSPPPSLGWAVPLWPAAGLPISVRHQGNRTTVGSEPGDTQPRLGRGGAGVFEGSVCRIQERLNPSPQFRLHSGPHRPRKALLGGVYHLLICAGLVRAPTLKSQEWSATVRVGSGSQRRGSLVWGESVGPC